MVLSLAYAWCNVPVNPVRKEPSHRAEQVTQLLFGERVEISEVDNNNWARIHIVRDGYEGWCKMGQLATIQKKEFRKEVKYLAGNHNCRLVMENSQMWLPLGCDLVGMKGGKIKPLTDAGKFKGKKLKVKHAELTAENLINAARLYLNAPYLWGGRTLAGIDCSGLVQMALKLCNRSFPRDAAQQSEEGQLVDFLQHGKAGDLAFFDNKEGKIVHVGILIDNQTIIHSTDTSGRVVIDRIDQAGIISTALKMRTHNLRFVKRIMP